MPLPKMWEDEYLPVNPRTGQWEDYQDRSDRNCRTRNVYTVGLYIQLWSKISPFWSFSTPYMGGSSTIWHIRLQVGVIMAAFYHIKRYILSCLLWKRLRSRPGEGIGGGIGGSILLLLVNNATGWVYGCSKNDLSDNCLTFCLFCARIRQVIFERRERLTRGAFRFLR